MYELAKKLKDAGFPQKGKGELHETEEGRKNRDAMGTIDSIVTYLTQVVYFPTLTELIEACGDVILWKTKDNVWNSDIYLAPEAKYIDDQFQPSIGSTPEQAVANLWLAINASKGTEINQETLYVTNEELMPTLRRLDAKLIGIRENGEYKNIYVSADNKYRIIQKDMEIASKAPKEN